jgi:hypothetical protein
MPNQASFGFENWDASMTPDWSRVTLEHVRRACEMFDNGDAQPKRPALTTFLHWNGNAYPAKFIRGVAYQLATDTKLDPSGDYAGGRETVKFFQDLGLVIEHAITASVAGVERSGAPGGLASVRQVVVATPCSAGDQVNKVALVSHDYSIPGLNDLYDYSEHFARINKACDDNGCDTILYALWTWNQTSAVARNHAAIFGGLVTVERVILEVWQPPENPEHVEVWVRGQESPVLAHQRFATSSSSDVSKQEFITDLPARQIMDALLVICGETNIASTIRGSEDINDPYGFTDQLAEMNIRLIFNPIHDYMTRYEMRRKRRHYSLGGRTVLSVWNQGKGKESYLPWTVFHNGHEQTEAVLEVSHAFSDRPDIRIGIVALSKL